MYSSFLFSQEETLEEPSKKSIFTDFRIPIRENVVESDLRYDGWKTDPEMYAFRCRDKKRIRLTLWYFNKGDNRTKGSEFVNITPAVGKCQKEDLQYFDSPETE
ncbi:hypothetical protein [Wenyingzhuangia sp. 2_MG-2023]|uniref:hypothetical protein n=1 Tax=Wenyingzhuangia sp. 2_MG-2023 TaxID=3062639 RepID=UPI0026E18A7B|nr:hypothetical protein [Wenyingzhuangia sp. 2_MG-2023]MDO6738293.1 hypothetical protein [Wenyingzhuangia sp. 2_MG-2023]